MSTTPTAPVADDVDAWAEAPVIDEFASVDEAAAAHDDEMFGPQDADLEPPTEAEIFEAAGLDLDEVQVVPNPEDESQVAPEPEASAEPAPAVTKLTPEQEAAADEMFNQHVLYKEIAERLGVPNRLISRRFMNRQRPPKAKGQAPRRVLPPPTDKALPTADWPTLVKGIDSISTGLVAWARGTYCMVRVATGYPAGVPKGAQLSDAMPFPWATVCQHGHVKGAMKGGVAEILGKTRDTWCDDCKAGKPGVVGASPQAPKPAKAEADLPVVRIDLTGADGPRIVPVEQEPPFADWVLRDEVSSRRVATVDLTAELAAAEAAAHQEQAERALAAKAEAGAEATAAAKKATRKRASRKS